MPVLTILVVVSCVKFSVSLSLFIYSQSDLVIKVYAYMESCVLCVVFFLLLFKFFVCFR